MGSKNGKPVLREEDIEALSKSSGMPTEEVKSAFESFVAEHPNGKMKPADFRKMMAQAMPKKDAGKMEKHVFRIYDSNNDGRVSYVVRTTYIFSCNGNSKICMPWGPGYHMHISQVHRLCGVHGYFLHYGRRICGRGLHSTIFYKF